jgi:hypothetical protein
LFIRKKDKPINDLEDKMARLDITQQELDALDVELAALETYLRDREQGHKIKVIFGLSMFVITTSIGIYFFWLAKI